MFGQIIEEAFGTKVITASVLTGYELVAGAPAQIYYTDQGVAKCLNGIVDSSSTPGHWGIAQAAYASLAVATLTVRGKAVNTAGAVTNSGVAVTAIAASGGFTEAAWASANGDLALGTTWTSGIIIY